MSKKNIDINVPPILIDNLQREHGIVLFAGNRNSGIEKTFKVIADKIQKQNKNSSRTIVLKDNSEFSDKFWQAITYDDLILKPLNEESKNSDYFIFENISKPIEFEAALEIAEDGRFVFMHFSCVGVINALHRIFGFYQPPQREHTLWRFLDETFLFYSQVEVSSETDDNHFAGEIMLLSPDIKKILFSSDIQSFSQKIKELNEDSGVVTLNQSLLQLLIRRKISIKKAFETTRDPMDLDLLLKKVGI